MCSRVRNRGGVLEDELDEVIREVDVGVVCRVPLSQDNICKMVGIQRHLFCL
jgi:hypothetical protein